MNFFPDFEVVVRYLLPPFGLPLLAFFFLLLFRFGGCVAVFTTSGITFLRGEIAYSAFFAEFYRLVIGSFRLFLLSVTFGFRSFQCFFFLLFAIIANPFGIEVIFGCEFYFVHFGIGIHCLAYETLRFCL